MGRLYWGGPGRRGGQSRGAGPHGSAPRRVQVWGHRVAAHALGEAGASARVPPSRGGELTLSRTLPGICGVAASPRGRREPLQCAAVRAEFPLAPGLSRASRGAAAPPAEPRTPDSGGLRTGVISLRQHLTGKHQCGDGGRLSNLSARGLRQPFLPASTLLPFGARTWRQKEGPGWLTDDTGRPKPGAAPDSDRGGEKLEEEAAGPGRADLRWVGLWGCQEVLVGGGGGRPRALETSQPPEPGLGRGSVGGGDKFLSWWPSQGRGLDQRWGLCL